MSKYNIGAYDAPLNYTGGYNTGTYDSGAYSPGIYDYRDFTPADVDLYMEQGDSYVKQITLKTADGLPIILTGYEVSAKLKRYFNSEKEFKISAKIVDIGSGTIELEVDEAENAKLIFDRYVYQVKLNTSSEVIRVLQGQVLMGSF